MARPACDAKDPVPFHTFWPVIGFGIFVCADDVVDDDDYRRDVCERYTKLVCVALHKTVHVATVVGMMLSMLEFVVALFRTETLCSRPLFAEMDYLVSFVALLLLIVLDSVRELTSPVGPDAVASPGAIFALGLGVWVTGMCVLGYQGVALLQRSGLLATLRFVR